MTDYLYSQQADLTLENALMEERLDIAVIAYDRPGNEEIPGLRRIAANSKQGDRIYVLSLSRITTSLDTFFSVMAEHNIPVVLLPSGKELTLTATYRDVRQKRVDDSVWQEIVELKEQGWSLIDLSKKFGVSRSSISRYLRGEQYVHQKKA